MKSSDDKKQELHLVFASLSKELETLLSQLNELENLVKKKLQLERLEKDLASIKEKLKQSVFNSEQFEHVREELAKKKIAYEKYNGELLNLRNQLKAVVDMAAMLEREIAQLESVEKEITHLIKLEEELTIYKNALLETQLALRANLMEAINLAMNEIWHIFYPYKNYKALRLNVTDKDYSFEIFDSEWRVLESIASGGERACAALTLRVALATVLTPNLSWLILDEPTHNLDKEAVDLLSQTLQFKVPNVIQQTFVITHEEGLMGSEFASNYRLARDKENFGATKIEKI